MPQNVHLSGFALFSGLLNLALLKFGKFPASAVDKCPAPAVVQLLPCPSCPVVAPEKGADWVAYWWAFVLSVGFVATLICNWRLLFADKTACAVAPLPIKEPVRDIVRTTPDFRGALSLPKLESERDIVRTTPDFTEEELSVYVPKRRIRSKSSVGSSPSSVRS